MPYIKKEYRSKASSNLFNVGELNYSITKLVSDYIEINTGTKYERINAAIGALECAKLELYRRIAAPYEDGKMRKNGDVYPYSILPDIEGR